MSLDTEQAAIQTPQKKSYFYFDPKLFLDSGCGNQARTEIQLPFNQWNAKI